RGEADENKAIIQERLDQVLIPLRCDVGDIELPLQQILSLSPGDVVRLARTHIKSDMEVTVGDRRKFKCRPGRIGNRLCLQIGDTIDEIPDELLGSTKSEEEI
ncbi:MAG: FliM/FliN family flagellar motor switch protein, partial [Leptospiraceae bacterium]|nr:FliM/FliN family flagellar motor switch protein [Leptospiraceae bacterium]